MNKEEIQLRIGEVLKTLDESGDIVITTTIPNVIIDKIIEAIGDNIKSLLSEDEYKAVLNSLNVLIHDVKLDSDDFQTIIGIEKENLKAVFDKLKLP